MRQLNALKEQFNGSPVFTLDIELVNYIKQELYQGRTSDHLERPRTVRATAKECGWFIGKTRAQIRSWGQETYGGYVVANDEELSNLTPGEMALSGLKPLMVSQHM